MVYVERRGNSKQQVQCDSFLLRTHPSSTVRSRQYRLARQSSTLSWPRNSSECLTGQYLQELGVSPFCQTQSIKQSCSTEGLYSSSIGGRAGPSAASLRSGGRGAARVSPGLSAPSERRDPRALRTRRLLPPAHTRARSRRDGQSPAGAASAAANPRQRRQQPRHPLPPRRSRPRSFPPPPRATDR